MMKTPSTLPEERLSCVRGKRKIERLILGKAYRVRARLTFFLLDLYNFSIPYHKKVKDFNTICGTPFNYQFKASMFCRNNGSYLLGGRRWSSSFFSPMCKFFFL